MKGILGKKMDMTQKFHPSGKALPVTAIQLYPCYITQIKTQERDGYEAVQIGAKEGKRISKPQRGHLSSLGKNLKILHEIRLNSESEKSAKELQVGKKIDIKIFQAGEKVLVTGVSKGKGFQGVVKRHGFHGGPKTHGHKDQLRMPGSIGDKEAARVKKGTRMGGRTGGDQVTVKNLEIIEIDSEKEILYVKGAIPGYRGSTVFIHAQGALQSVE